MDRRGRSEEKKEEKAPKVWAWPRSPSAWRGMCLAGYVVYSPRVVFLSVVSWPRCSASWPV